MSEAAVTNVMSKSQTHQRRKTLAKDKQRKAAEDAKREQEAGESNMDWLRRLATGAQQTVQKVRRATEKGAVLASSILGGEPPACAQFTPLERLWVQTPI